MIKLISPYAGAILTILIMIMAITACAPGMQLLTTGVQKAEVKGTFTLLLYGCHYPDDVKNVAILLDEGNTQPFEIYDIKTSYKVKKGISAQEALSQADSFVKCSTRRVTDTELRRIPDGSGGILGYELRPLYFPLEFGSSDIMLISYSLKDGMIRAYIRLLPDVERQIEAVGSDRRDHSGK
jgi:hypothetical protein